MMHNLPEPSVNPPNVGDRDCVECSTVFDKARNVLGRECNVSIEGSPETAHCISCCASSDDRALLLRCECESDVYEHMHYTTGAA